MTVLQRSVEMTNVENVFALEARRIQLYILMIIADAALIAASFFIVDYLYLGDSGFSASRRFAGFVAPVFILVAFYRRLYSIDCLVNLKNNFKTVAYCIALSATLQVLVGFFSKTSDEFSRVVLAGGLVVSGAIVCLFHAVLISSFRQMYAGRFVNALIIDAGGPAIKLPRAHFLSLRNLDIDKLIRSPDNLHRFGEMVLPMDRVIVSCPVKERGGWAYLLQCAGVKGEVTSRVLQEMGATSIQVEDDFTSILISNGPLGLRNRTIKRIMDLAFVIPAIVVLAPVFLAISFLIWREDRGPVLFIQQRMGQGNVYFDMLKFRSMKVQKADLTGQVSTKRGDTRITGIGRVLRATSLDELPQLFNVLLGQMSIVGPRPHATGSTAGGKLFWEVSAAYWRRHALKPGLTGLAQIRGHRGATDLEEDLANRLKSDLEYLASWSPIRDVLITARTIKVLVHQNAY